MRSQTVPSNILSHACAAGGIIVAWVLLGTGTSWSQIIPADRRVDWTQSGVPGGVPNRTTIFTNLYPGATAAQINAAIAACPSNQVVYLNAGTYNITGGINISKDFVTVRGAGTNTVISFIPQGGNSFGVGFTRSCYALGNAVNIASGFMKGSASITLASAPPASLKVGYIAVIDQLNDNVMVVNNGVGGKRNDISRDSGNRCLHQSVEITGISGNTVTFSPPLYWTYSASLTPQLAFEIPANESARNNYTRMSGVENLKVRPAQSGGYFNIHFSNAAYCWAKNVVSEWSANASVQAWFTFRCELRDSLVKDTQGESPGGNYGLDLNYYNTGWLIENNIFDGIKRGNVLINAGSAGNVVGYNFGINPRIPGSPNMLPHTMGLHSSHSMMNLWEGNVDYKFVADFYWGSTSHTTLFRNWWKGIAPGTYSEVRAITFDMTNRWNNIVGNVLGFSGITSSPNISNFYSLRVSPATFGYQGTYASYRIGYYSDGETDIGTRNPNGAADQATNLMHGNYDYVTGSIGWDNSITDTNIPASLYRSSKPAWWNTSPWPPIGPDVAGRANAIPAEDRYNGVAAPVLVPPPAPTNLQIFQ